MSQSCQNQAPNACWPPLGGTQGWMVPGSPTYSLSHFGFPLFSFFAPMPGTSLLPLLCAPSAPRLPAGGSWCGAGSSPRPPAVRGAPRSEPSHGSEWEPPCSPLSAAAFWGTFSLSGALPWPPALLRARALAGGALGVPLPAGSTLRAAGTAEQPRGEGWRPRELWGGKPVI